MDDLWKKQIELAVHNHNRRLDDYETQMKVVQSDVVKDRADIDMLKQIAESNHDILQAVKELKEYAQKTYEVFEPLARYGAKVVKLGVLFTAGWHALKYAYAKLMMVWP